MSEPEDTLAPDGKVWVCLACGKYTKDKFGNDRGWDGACMLNSHLFNIIDLVIDNGRVIAIKKEIVESIDDKETEKSISK